jgi:regulator of sigma E protease
MLEQAIHLAQTLAIFAFVLGVLVFIHEMGHYLAARACGITVEAFSLGFGPALKSWPDRRGTVWKICILPLGGYVKMYGMSPEARADADAAGEVFRAGEAYCEKPVWQRSIVAAAGPVANFLLAIVLFGVLLGTTGRQVALPVVGKVIADSAAAHAGLQLNDQILAVNGQAVTDFDQLRQVVVANPNKDVTLALHRGSTDLTVVAHVLAGPTGAGILGVQSGGTRIDPVSLPAALAGGFTQTWDLLNQIVLGLISLVTGQTSADNLGGVISIADMSGRAARLGLVSLLTWIAALSVNLGLVNLLPIPVLDGGHLMFYAAEAVRGRPVPVRAQEYGYRVGIAIIASIFVFAFRNDLEREGAFRWVAHLIG